MFMHEISIFFQISQLFYVSTRALYTATHKPFTYSQSNVTTTRVNRFLNTFRTQCFEENQF